MNVLLVVPSFHPASKVEALRWTAFSRILSEEGFNFSVAVPRGAGWTRPSSGLSGELIRSAAPWVNRVISLPFERQLPLHRIIELAGRKLTGRHHAPDNQYYYWQQHAQRLIEPSLQFDCVVTSSPSHSIHLVGLRLAATGVPWIADFRDPLTSDPRSDFGSAQRRALLRSFEQKVHLRAEQVTHAIPKAARQAQATYSSRAAHIHSLPNGAPIDDMPLQNAPLSLSDSLPVRVVSTGKFGPKELSDLASACRLLTQREFQFEIFGSASAEGANTSSPVDSRIKYFGQVAHVRALEAISGPALLVALLPIERSKVGGVSSKLYEYLVTGNPVIAVNPTEGDKNLLDGFERCWYLEEAKQAELAEIVRIAIDSKPLTPGALAARRADLSRTRMASKVGVLIRRAVESRLD